MDVFESLIEKLEELEKTSEHKSYYLNLSIILDTFNSNKIKQLPISHENTVSA